MTLSRDRPLPCWLVSCLHCQSAWRKICLGCLIKSLQSCRSSCRGLSVVPSVHMLPQFKRPVVEQPTRATLIGLCIQNVRATEAWCTEQEHWSIGGPDSPWAVAVVYRILPVSHRETLPLMDRWVTTRRATTESERPEN